MEKTFLIKNLVHEYTSFEIDSAGLRLIGGNEILPGGTMEGSLSFDLDGHSYDVVFNANIPYFERKPFNKLTRDKVTLIHEYDENIDFVERFVPEDSVFARKLDWYLQEAKKAQKAKGVTLEIHVFLNSFCFDHLPPTTTKQNRGFVQHFAQMLSTKADPGIDKIVRDEYIQLNNLTFCDLLEKGFIKESDKIVSTRFSSNGNSYKKISLKQAKEMYPCK